MGFTIVEKKIFICSLGIVLITLICYVFFTNFDNIREPLPGPLGSFPFEFTIQGFIQLITTTTNFIKQKMDDIRNNLMANARSASTDAKVKMSELKLQATATNNQIASTAQRNVIAMKQQLRDTAYAIKNQTGQLAIAGQNRAYQAGIEAKNTIQRTTGIRRTFQFFRKFWKYILAVILFFSSVGQWFVNNVQTLIYRIANFKNCFLWYFLEIIGWIFYIPIEFFVWLFCLKDMENMAWDSLKQFDCTFNDITGFHFIYFSDDVIKKCYSRKFVPFPKMNFEFKMSDLEKEIGKFIMDFLLPISPDDVKQIKEIATNESKKSSNELSKEVSPVPVM